MRRDVAASPRRGSHRLSLLTVPRAASREAHCQADRGINLSAVESRKLVDRKYCFIAIGDLFTEKISHAPLGCETTFQLLYYLPNGIFHPYSVLYRNFLSSPCISC